MSERNKHVVDDFIQAVFTEGDLDAVERCLSPDFVNHHPFPQTPGTRDGFRQAAAMVRAACPDWRSTLHQLVAEGDLVAERFTARGTHRGDFLGSPPSGNEVVMDGINLWRIHDGQITERWGILDLASVMEQLGLFSSATSA